MYELLAGIYHKLSGNALIRWAGDQYLQGFPVGNLQAYLRLKKVKSSQRDSSQPVRVVFIQQNKVNWQVVKKIYEKMHNDSRFEAYIIAVPEKMDSDPEAAYKNLVNLYGENAVIRTGIEGEPLFDIRQLNPDYVFLPRPYDQYLPGPYQSKVISSYARICYMSYSFEMSKQNEKDVFNGRFFRNVSVFFAESGLREEFEKKRYPYGHRKGIRQTVCLGYPSLSEYSGLKPREKDGYVNLLWTPRWNEDPALGGSSFLEFKDKIIDYVNSHDNVRLIFRPHPLLFHHFVSTGRLSQEEADRYLDQFDGEKLIYDDKPGVQDSFSAADILVTDISSIIAPYILTGKPMIYCDTGAILNEFSVKIMSGGYHTASWQEVQDCLDQLLAGNDPNRERRNEILETYMAELKDDHTDEILDYLYNSVSE